MTQKLVKGAILGGIVLFVWGVINWTILPWHQMHIMKFQKEESDTNVIRENVMENGIYVLPHMTEREGQNMDGLFMFASVCLASKHEGMGVPLVKSLILKVILAFIVTWLLLRTRLAYNKQVGFITVIGVVIALGAAVPPWIWAAFPIGFTLACLFEIIVGWFLAGLVIAKVTK